MGKHAMNETERKIYFRMRKWMDAPNPVSILKDSNGHTTEIFKGDWLLWKHRRQCAKSILAILRNAGHTV